MSKSMGNFLAASGILLVAFLITLNLTTSTEHLWAIWAAPFLLITPIYFLLNGSSRRHLTAFSIIATVISLAILFITNMIESPHYWWFLYTVPAFLAWPAIMIGGKKSSTKSFAILGGTAIAVAYVALNIFFEPRFPWSIFPVFAIIWWPLAVVFAKNPRLLSLVGTAWIVSLVLATNFVTTPNIAWWIYPVFAIMFWPLSMYLARHPFRFSAVITTWIMLFFVTLNWLLTPSIVWWIYPVFAIMFWPLSIYFFVNKRKEVANSSPKK